MQPSVRANSIAEICLIASRDEHYGCSTLGKFLSDWGAVCTREMDWTELKLLIEGIEIGRRRKRLDLRSSPPNIVDHNAAGVPIMR